MTPGTATPERAQRLFFALWPDELARAALANATARAMRHSGGRPVPAANLHVTLAFLGTIPLSRVAELRRVAREQAAALTRDRAIALTFEQLGNFRQAQVLCAFAAPEESAAALARALQDASAAAGFNPDLKPFRAHVTLARKVVHAPAPAVLRPVVWEFTAFALIDSRTEPAGPVYSVVETYSLVELQKVHE